MAKAILLKNLIILTRSYFTISFPSCWPWIRWASTASSICFNYFSFITWICCTLCVILLCPSEIWAFTALFFTWCSCYHDFTIGALDLGRDACLLIFWWLLVLTAFLTLSLLCNDLILATLWHDAFFPIQWITNLILRTITTFSI